MPALDTAGKIFDQTLMYKDIDPYPVVSYKLATKVFLNRLLHL